MSLPLWSDREICASACTVVDQVTKQQSIPICLVHRNTWQGDQLTTAKLVRAASETWSTCRRKGKIGTCVIYILRHQLSTCVRERLEASQTFQPVVDRPDRLAKVIDAWQWWLLPKGQPTLYLSLTRLVLWDHEGWSGPVSWSCHPFRPFRQCSLFSSATIFRVGHTYSHHRISPIWIQVGARSRHGPLSLPRVLSLAVLSHRLDKQWMFDVRCSARTAWQVRAWPAGPTSADWRSTNVNAHILNRFMYDASE